MKSPASPGPPSSPSFPCPLVFSIKHRFPYISSTIASPAPALPCATSMRYLPLPPSAPSTLASQSLVCVRTIGNLTPKLHKNCLAMLRMSQRFQPYHFNGDYDGALHIARFLNHQSPHHHSNLLSRNLHKVNTTLNFFTSSRSMFNVQILWKQKQYVSCSWYLIGSFLKRQSFHNHSNLLSQNRLCVITSLYSISTLHFYFNQIFLYAPVIPTRPASHIYSLSLPH